MRQADVYVDAQLAGILTEWHDRQYEFEYCANYQGLPVSFKKLLAERARCLLAL